ncbi:MAG: formate dehydrogenase subunit alpha [Rhodospirillales bacterium]|nr:formate dehydrogenase subunit alpha [Rhodospirillales bacterium]
MSNEIRFSLDGKDVIAQEGESLLKVAERQGIEIPRLCYSEQPGYRADGNCRACVMEVEGERTLAASCRREPTEGMVVRTQSERAANARNIVMELITADQPENITKTELSSWIASMGIRESRFKAHEQKQGVDKTNPAISVDMAACIHCGRCVRACREVQMNDVIGMAGRGSREQIVFDMADTMGTSTCVSCGECVQACPTAALLPTKISESVEKSVDSLCPFCGVGCQVTYHVKDNAINHVTGRDGPANQGRLCVKGRFGMDYPSHPHRLTTPLIRRDDALKAGDIEIDPANPLSHFREATWEEALTKAAEGFKAIRDSKGGGALAGFGSAKGSNEEAYLFQKLIRTGFGTNNVDHCTRLCHASSVAALMETIGSGAVTAPFIDAESADVIIVIGSNPASNHPVAATYFKNAVSRGAELVIIDPRGQSGLSRYASHNLRFKNGTDVALLNGMMNVIITEELYDKSYIESHTEGFEALKQHISAFTPEEMALICGIDAKTIAKVARTYAKAPKAMIFWGMGISQHTHGTDNARCLISLALMCGQVGRPGTGLHPLRGQNNVQGASDSGLIPFVYPDYRSVEDPEVQAFYEDYWETSLDPKKGLTVVEIMDAVYDGKITGMYIMGENPAMSDPDLNHARGALAKLEHLVVQDIFLTETAWHADVVLPASAFPEKDGTYTNTDRRVQIGRQALELPGEARQDWQIIQDLAQGLGLDWRYTHPKDIFAEMRGCLKGFAGISWERLEKEGSVTYPCSAEDMPGQDVLFGDGFPTENGRGKFVPAQVIEPDELPDEEYPMILSTGRLLEHWHTGSMTRRSHVLDAIEPEAIVMVSPQDLARLGILPGEEISVSSRRGSVKVIARAVENIEPGTLFMPFCFNEGPANKLTNSALDPFGKIPELKFCAVCINK